MLLIAIALPLLAAAALFAWKPQSRKIRSAFVFAATVLTSGCVGLCLFTPGEHALTLLRVTSTMTISFRLDGLGRVFAGLVGFLWPLATLYAFEYMKDETGENAFFGFYLISYGITLAIAFAEDLMTLYIFYELLSLATLFLVTHGMKPQSVYAGRKYIYYMLGGAALAFLSLVTVIHCCGGGNFTPGGIPAMAEEPGQLTLVMFTLGFVGFGVKAAIFPFHGWLPSASVAPTPVTALLHAVAVVKAGAFAVIRLTYNCYGTELLRGTWAQTVCLSITLVTILIGSGMAVRERHIKRRLAYSTMSNLSYVLFGAMLMTAAGLRGGLTHMVYHALMKLTLFCCAGAVMQRTGGSYISEMRGLSARMPFVMAIFAFGAVELTGIPPFIGFQSKWALASAGLESGTALGVAGVAVLLISAVLTAVYMLTPTVIAYAPPDGQSGARINAKPGLNRDPGWRMKASLILLTLVMLALAFWSEPLLRYLGRVASAML